MIEYFLVYLGLLIALGLIVVILGFYANAPKIISKSFSLGNILIILGSYYTITYVVAYIIFVEI